MFLKRIILTDFKNISSTDLKFSPKINSIYGDNGVGKTNLLDAIYYLSMTKSFFLTTDQYVVKHDSLKATLFGSYSLCEDDTEDSIAISLEINGKKVVKRNGKNYSKFSQHIGLIPIVIVSPSDINLINSTGEERRRFLNFILSQIDSEYLKKLQSYNRLLAQRNSLLKKESIDTNLITVISDQLSIYAQYIYEKRSHLVELLNESVMDYYSPISGNRESVSMEYVSDLKRNSMSDLLNKYYQRDVMFKYTTVGIQRDDINFMMDSHLMKKCASQGQQKSFLISLKLAQFALTKKIMGVSPILLLDDLFDKLDLKRVKYLMELVSSDNFGQIFITDSDRERVRSVLYPFDQSAFFVVKDGAITHEEH